MNKKDIALLEKAFVAEVGSALQDAPPLMQTRSEKRANALVADGLLIECNATWKGIVIKGFALTHAGRSAYCSTCERNYE